MTPNVDRGTHGVHERGIFSPELLDTCIACGFCLPACPTYALTGQEQYSPRGRISLMRALEAGRLDVDDPALVEQASACLGCRACEPVCPAGVQYGQLLEQWRDHQWRGRRRPLISRALMLVVQRSWLLRLQGLVRRHARTGRRGANQVAAGQAPTAAVTTPTQGQAHLMLGCVERGLYPSVSRAAKQLCPELDVPSGQGCCGALHAHNGDSATGERLAHELGERLPGTIVTTSGGCSGHLAAVLGKDRIRELSEYLVSEGFRPDGVALVDGRRARVTLQDSCHLRNGKGVFRQPRELLGQVADYVELPDAASCCGAAGTYSMLRPKESREIVSAKLAAIEALNVDYVITLNPGCQRQLAGALRKARSPVKAVHIADLLANLTGLPT